MTDVQGLPEHHRAYIYARAAVLAEDTSTDALDALVRRGFTDAEELRMRDRRYLAARGTIVERGEDLAVLDAHAEELLDHHTEGDSPPAGAAQAATPSILEGKEQEAAEQACTTWRRCALPPRSKRRCRRRCAWPHSSAASCTGRHPRATQDRGKSSNRAESSVKAGSSRVQSSAVW